MTDTPAPIAGLAFTTAEVAITASHLKWVRDTVVRSLERDLTACRAVLREQSVVDVLAERQRQIEREGWTPEHDDAHDAGDMATAATCYVLNAACVLSTLDGTEFNPFAGGGGLAWPWDEKWWKPTTPRRDLVKAAALILAEIDRLDRAAARAILQSTGEGEGK